MRGHLKQDCSGSMTISGTRVAGGGGGGGDSVCNRCGKNGHFARECTQSAHSGGGDVCYRCGKSGHYSRECPSAGGGANHFIALRQKEAQDFQIMRKRQKLLEDEKQLNVPPPPFGEPPDLMQKTIEKPGPKKKQVVMRIAVKPKSEPKPKPDISKLHPALRPASKVSQKVEESTSDGEGDKNAGGGLGALMAYGSSDSDDES